MEPGMHPEHTETADHGATTENVSGHSNQQQFQNTPNANSLSGAIDGIKEARIALRKARIEAARLAKNKPKAQNDGKYCLPQIKRREESKKMIQMSDKWDAQRLKFI
jgi:hypothetical protein